MSRWKVYNVLLFTILFLVLVSLVPSERSKNIAKIGMIPGKGQIQAEQRKADKNKPKFVEMHQYPGFDPNELTPLPLDVTSRQILDKVTASNVDLIHKPKYKKDYDKLFYSSMTEAMLVDIFWYYFLERFRSSKHAQRKLFDRTARNYVQLLTYSYRFEYRAVFLKDFAELLSQAVYAAFCWVFPDSYHQFGENFKDGIMSLVYQWINGVRPPPRVWTRWNMQHLEPERIRNREELMHKNNEKGWNLDWLDNRSTFDYASSINSSRTLLSNRTSRRRRLGRVRGRQSDGSEHSSSSDASSKPKKKTSTSREKLTASLAVESDSSERTENSTSSPRKTSRGSTHAKRLVPESLDVKRSQEGIEQTLTPILEAPSEASIDRAKTDATPRADTHHQSTYLHPEKKHRMKSHPACRGPDFAPSTFNVYGRSPLVEHFMTVSGLQNDAGTSVYLTHKEIRNLAPMDAPTYRDVIKDSLKTLEKRGKDFKLGMAIAEEENLQFARQQRQLLRDHRARESSLLTNKAEVKRLADLLMLDANRDQGSIAAGSTAEIERSLMANTD